jgi:hypothetical protein
MDALFPGELGDHAGDHGPMADAGTVSSIVGPGSANEDTD